MTTIFTRATAAKKVILLLEYQCGLTRGDLWCDARLESDLGVVGDDAYDILRAMSDELGVDMTEFDCGDRITPECAPPPPMLQVILVISLGLLVSTLLYPDGPKVVFLLAPLIGLFVLLWVRSLLIRKADPELRVRDLVHSVEAGHWVSPKRNKSQMASR